MSVAGVRAEAGAGGSAGAGAPRMPESTTREMDAAVAVVRESADRFARLSLWERIQLLTACLEGTYAEATGSVAAACAAKGLDPHSALAGEEWLGGPLITVRTTRLYIQSLEEIAAHGRPQLGRGAVVTADDGRVTVRTFPASGHDAQLFAGVRCDTWMQDDVSARGVAAHQAELYQRQAPAGRTCLVLGAGNVASIGPLDVLDKMFLGGMTVVLKMNPVNEYLGPYVERAFRALVDAGYLRLVYGGAGVGAYLCNHPGLDEVHITGSDKTHDAIVWGPPGPEHEARKRRQDPLLKKEITSELGNVTPVILVPGPYSDDELWFQARNVAGMVANNASFNCNAAKLLITPRGWDGRERFLAMVEKALGMAPMRRAYYPGAMQRWNELCAGRANVRRIGAPSAPDELPWAFVPGLDAADEGETLFRVEPFCGVLAEVPVGSADPAEFLHAAVPFANDRVWGTLAASLIVHPGVQSDAGAAGAAFGEAIRDLRYGAVCVNTWAGTAYGFGSTPWGAHHGSTLADVQSGRGFVHNSYMLGKVLKSVVRAPLKGFPAPPWFPGHRTVRALARKLVGFERAPSWWKFPGIVATAMRA
jgi:aldehyde dehydrogenase (NAD(P)+)